jgi:indole-3-glycerol phosphate synthase
MDILEKIAAFKKEEVKIKKRLMPVNALEKSAFFKREMPSFYEALAKEGPSVIGEFKRKSPSKGIINVDADIRRVALGYQSGGISAMSILTDEEFFGGNGSDLEEAAGFLKIPVLRKDFIVDEYQVTEAKSIGAAAILLIASMLSKKEVETFSELAISLGLDILFEIHDLADLEKFCEKIKVVGVNNRNLKTFEVSMDSSEALFKYLPHECLKVAESGFRSVDDARNLFNQGYDAFLIGESFMKSDDPGSAAARFVYNLKSAIK